jgi:hypothetical protein
MNLKRDGILEQIIYTNIRTLKYGIKISTREAQLHNQSG